MEPSIAAISRRDSGRAFPFVGIGFAARIWWAVAWLLCSVPLMLATPAYAQQRVVRVGVYDNSPKIFTNTSGKADGIFIDILKEVARREGWHLRFVRGSWSEGLTRLARGEIDLMPDVAYSDERAELYAFHNEPVLASWFQVYASKQSNIRSLLDLRNKRVAVLEQSVQQEAFLRLVGGYHLKINLLS